jgi:hypothetical protein
MTSHFTYTVHGSGPGRRLDDPRAGETPRNTGSGELAAGIRGAGLIEIDAGHGVVTAVRLPFLFRLA